MPLAWRPPFASYCGAEFDTNRVERIAFCIKPINVSNAICQPAFDAICPIEPFTPYCGTLFDNTRSEREAFCKLDGNAVHETCAGGDLRRMLVLKILLLIPVLAAIQMPAPVARRFALNPPMWKPRFAHPRLLRLAIPNPLPAIAGRAI